MAVIPHAGPYPAAAVHYVGTHTGLTDAPACTAAIVTAVTGPERATLTLFYPQGVPAPGASAVYDPNPVAEAREAGTWHWPADCMQASQ